MVLPTNFNPLPPRGGRLRAFRDYGVTASISIHSLRVEGDLSRAVTLSLSCYFNPLPPRGGRRWKCSKIPKNNLFQSTPSAWRETSVDSFSPSQRTISIHSLRVEGDYSKQFAPTGTRVFQSTPSAWRETKSRNYMDDKLEISIHSLRVEGDQRIF